jgi:hypothetical protein
MEQTSVPHNTFVQAKKDPARGDKMAGSIMSACGEADRAKNQQ